MKHLQQKFLIATLLSSLIACSGNGGLAGIGGSGYIATGTVTGFGSIIVNSVKFETNSAVYEIEDATGTQGSLSIGMVVQIEGSINADGVTGTATAVRYGDQLEGPVDAAAGEPGIFINKDENQKLFRVLGTNVVVDVNETVFEGTNFDFDSVAIDNTVEISGYYDNNQQLRATYIERKALVFDANEPVEIEGLISNLVNTQFKVRNVNVNAASANLSDLEDGLENGVLVEVKGLYDRSSNTIIAEEVEAESVRYVEDEEISIEGYVTRYVSKSDFDVNGIPVDASTAEFEPASFMLMAGKKIEVEGQFVNNVLVATEVESEEGGAEVHAVVTSIDSANSLFVVDADGDPGINQPITIHVDSSTTMEDSVAEKEPFLLTHLAVNNFVEVTGFESGVDSIDAIKVKRVDPTGKPNLLQGNATAATGSYAAGGAITILDVVYDFPASDPTVFENETDDPMSEGEVDSLIGQIQSMIPVTLKIKDTNNNGTANEIDIE